LKDGARHNYTKTQLEPWAKFIRKQSRAGKNVYAYFNNDLNVRAPDNAKMLMKMVGNEAVKAPSANIQAPEKIQTSKFK
jgi:uncharacterized protein YecE (DUF72 family)